MQSGLPRWWLRGKESIWNVRYAQKMGVQFPLWEEPLEEEMATHSSILAWRIPWTEESGGLQSMGLQRVRYNWVCTMYVQSSTFFFFGGKFLLVCEAFSSHEKTVTTVKGVSAFLYMRRHNNWLIELIKSALEIIYLKTHPASFPGTQGASFLLSTLNSFRGCWRSAAAAAHDPIFVEADGKRPGQVPIGGWQTLWDLTR